MSSLRLRRATRRPASLTDMHVTDLAINKAMGMQIATDASAHILELPEGPLLLNHIGTVHASVQFALAEACSGEFLLRQLSIGANGVLAVLRTSEVKFRKPARGALRASALFAEGGAEAVSTELRSRGRVLVSVLVEVSDTQGVTMSGLYNWFLQKPGGAV